MEIQRAPIATAEMLIRKPVTRVFEAFINPDITTKFWFTKSSGPLEPGKQIHWEWEMYGASTEVNVQAIEPNKRILIEWSGYTLRTNVEWVFTPHGNNATFVSITESGFGGDEAVNQALDSTAGFTMVLAGLKAYVEHNINLNLIADRFPDALVKQA
ncbi:MAG: SRPBCC family protein [Chloroflexi bacterium]|nr:SRPBCC family protein [Chloroflexota bacterium]